MSIFSNDKRNLIFFMVCSLFIGIGLAFRFDSSYRFPVSIMIVLVTFIACLFIEHIINGMLTNIEQKRRLRLIEESDEDTYKSSKNHKKRDKKALDQALGEVAITYSDSKFPAWFRFFITGGYSGVSILRANLAAAGFVGRYAIHKFVALRIAGTALVGLMFGIGIPEYFELMQNTYILLIQAACALVGGGIGFWQTDRYIAQKGRERADKMSMTLPDAVDILTIYVSAGVPLDAALDQSYSSLMRMSPAVAYEFKKLSEDLNISQDRAKAFDSFLHRCDNKSVREFVSIVKQADRDGSPISNAFRKLSSVLRKERALHIEKKAAKIPSLLLLPQILILLPSFMILILFSSIYDLFQSISSIGL